MPRVYLPMICASMLAASSAAAPPLERNGMLLDAVAETPAALSNKLEPYLGAQAASPLGWSAKGELLIAARVGELSQLQLIAQPGGERLQVTFAPHAVSRAAFSPDPGRGTFVYAQAAAGAVGEQLYYQRLGEADAKRLTDGKSRNGAPVWSNSGHELAFFSSARDGVSSDIVVMVPGTGLLPRLVMTGDGTAWCPLDWSPDDRKLLVLKTVSDAETYLYVVDVASGQKHEVDPASGKTKILDARFSRDGQGVFFISDRDSEFTKLRYVNMFSAEKSVVAGTAPGDVEEIALSRDGHYLAYASNEAGASKLSLLNTRSHQELTPPRLSAGVIDALHFDDDGKRLAFALGTPNAPRDAYVLDVAANRVEAWSHSEAGSIDSSKVVLPRLTQYPTFDRQDGRPRLVPVYVFEPNTAGPHPALIIFHGGPNAQYQPIFDPFVQFVVNELGYAVIAPNVRGSSGYGKTYAILDDGVLRDDTVKDAGALIVWLGMQNTFDAKRIVVAGADYGGFLALAALVNYDDRLRGGIDIGGIGDLVSFLSSASVQRQRGLRAEYGDERDPDMRAFLRRISPLTNADRISHPVLVVHGKDDERVPLSESDQIVNRLRSHNVEVWYLQARGEGAEFTHKSSRDALWRVAATFLATLR